MSHPLPEEYFQSLDDLVNIEYKAKRTLLGGTRLRYDAARPAAGMPLILQAVRLLAGLKPKTTILMTTGAGNPETLPQGETDGPSGAAFLAHLLHSRGHKIVVLSDEAFLPGIAAAFAAVGLADQQNASVDGVSIRVFPLGEQAGQREVKALLAEYPEVGAGIFIEKPGPNDRGVFHTSAGKPKDPALVAHLHLLADALTSRGSVTIGIGDGGNEIGFGNLARSLEVSLPQARDCGCGCGGGVVSATCVDSLICAATSNWGAYGVAVGLSIMAGSNEGLPPIEAVRTTVEASVQAGANDGYSGENVSTVDGTALAANEAVYTLCLEVARQARRLCND